MVVIEIPVRRTIDVRRMDRPSARLRLVRALEAVEVGDVIAMWTDDAAYLLDIRAWADAAGHRLIGIEARDGVDEIFVERRR